MAPNTILPDNQRGIGAIIGRVASGAGGVVNSLISGKVLMGMVAGVLMVMALLLWNTTRERDAARKTNRDIGAAVAVAAGVDPTTFKVEQIIPTLRTIATDRDTARRERDNFRSATTRQTSAVNSLGAETRRQRARADEAVRAVRSAMQERDVWIDRAKRASTRTQRLTAEAEIKQTEEVLDALYSNGF